MTISTTLSKINKSPVALIMLSLATTVAAAVAASKNKPRTVTALVGITTGLQAREFYLRHKAGKDVIQKILSSSNDVKNIDVVWTLSKSMETDES